MSLSVLHGFISKQQSEEDHTAQTPLELAARRSPPPPPPIGVVQLNIQDPATVVSSRVTQDSDLLQENQSGNKRVTMGDTNRVL